MDWMTIAGILTAVATLFGVGLALLKIVLGQFERRMADRFAGLEKVVGDENIQTRELKRQVEALAQSLPVEYVRREDWIRFSTVIDTKLDRLGERLSDLTRAELARMSVMRKGE